MVLTHYLFSALWEAGDAWTFVDLEFEARDWTRFVRRNPHADQLVYWYLDWRQVYDLEHLGMELIEQRDGGF